jgi:hypothetical protein
VTPIRAGCSSIHCPRVVEQNLGKKLKHCRKRLPLMRGKGVALRTEAKPQISPLRYAPVEMTNFPNRQTAAQGSTNSSSRPEESWAMKNAFCSTTTFLGSIALPFVIPSEAEGSAVPRTSPGNVFRQSSVQVVAQTESRIGHLPIRCVHKEGNDAKET